MVLTFRCGGVVGSASVVVVVLLPVALPDGWSPFSLGETGSTLRTVALLAGGMVTFVLASLDPARGFQDPDSLSGRALQADKR